MDIDCCVAVWWFCAGSRGIHFLQWGQTYVSLTQFLSAPVSSEQVVEGIKYWAKSTAKRTLYIGSKKNATSADGILKFSSSFPSVGEWFAVAILKIALRSALVFFVLMWLSFDRSIVFIDFATTLVDMFPVCCGTCSDVHGRFLVCLEGFTGLSIAFRYSVR